MFRISKQLIRIAISIEKQQKLQNMILNNEKLKEQKELTIKQLCEILNISKGYYHENSKYIKPLLDKIHVNIVDSRKINYEKLIKNNQILKNKKELSKTQLLQALNISDQAFQDNKDEITTLLIELGVKIIDGLRKNFKTIILNNNKLKDNTKINLKQLANATNLSSSVLIKNIDKITYYLNKRNIQLIDGRKINLNILLTTQELKDYSTTTYKQLQKILNTSRQSIKNNRKQIIELLKQRNITLIYRKIKDINYEKIILENNKLTDNSQIKITDFLRIMDITRTQFNNHKHKILPALQKRNITLTNSNKKDFYNSIMNNNELKNNSEICLQQLIRALNTTDTSIKNNWQEINNALQKRNITIIQKKSMLESDFITKLKQLPNIKIAYSEIQLYHNEIKNIFYSLTKKSQNITAKKQYIATKKSQYKLNNLLNNLICYIQNINKSPYDFYIQTINGTKYLIESQGEQHYNFRPNNKFQKNAILRIIIDAAKMLVACKYNCNFIATYDVKAKKNIKESLDVFNDFYMTTEEAIQLIKNDKTVDKHKIKRCAITMLNKIRNKFEDRIDQLSQSIKEQRKTNKEILEQIRKY